MSGLELRNAATMRAAQSAWDNASEEDADERTSSQPLGDTSVLVSFVVDGSAVTILGAYINAEFVDEGEFSRGRCDSWRQAIRREVDDAAADRAECARLQDAMDREDVA